MEAEGKDLIETEGKNLWLVKRGGDEARRERAIEIREEVERGKLSTEVRKIERAYRLSGEDINKIFERPGVNLTIELLGKRLVYAIEALQNFETDHDSVKVKAIEASIKAIELGLKARGVFEEHRVDITNIINNQTKRVTEIDEIVLGLN